MCCKVRSTVKTHTTFQLSAPPQHPLTTLFNEGFSCAHKRIWSVNVHKSRHFFSYYRVTSYNTEPHTHKVPGQGQHTHKHTERHSATIRTKTQIVSMATSQGFAQFVRISVCCCVYTTHMPSFSISHPRKEHTPTSYIHTRVSVYISSNFK